MSPSIANNVVIIIIIILFIYRAQSNKELSGTKINISVYINQYGINKLLRFHHKVR